jgi:hypothetical protein
MGVYIPKEKQMTCDNCHNKCILRGIGKQGSTPKSADA